MARIPIPSDWDEETDGYCTMTLTVPNSQYWRAIAKGKIGELTLNRVWDVTTGDIVEATDQAIIMRDSISLECLHVVPINVAKGTIVSQLGNEYVIASEFLDGLERVRIRINYIAGSGWVDSDIYAATVDAFGYVPDNPNRVFAARDRAGVVLGYEDEMDKYCGPDFGRVDLIGEAGNPFTLMFLVGPLCP